MAQSSNKPSPKSQEQQEQEASILLDNLKREVQTAQKYSARLREEAEGQTKKILQNRAAQLADLEELARQRLEPLHIQEKQAREAVDWAKARKNGLEMALTGLDSQIDTQRRIISELDQRISDQKAHHEDLQVKNTAVLVQIAELQEKTFPLQATIESLRDQINHLSAKRDLLRDQIDAFRTEFEVLNAEKQRAVTVLESKREHLETEIIQMLSDLDAQRQDLATRIRAANDKEEVLKRREVKVAREEADNRRNASLMDL